MRVLDTESEVVADWSATVRSQSSLFHTDQEYSAMMIALFLQRQVIPDAAGCRLLQIDLS